MLSREMHRQIRHAAVATGLSAMQNAETHRMVHVCAPSCLVQPFNGTRVLITKDLPNNRSHAAHYLRITPDGTKLLVPQVR